MEEEKDRLGEASMFNPILGVLALQDHQHVLKQKLGGTHKIYILNLSVQIHKHLIQTLNHLVQILIHQVQILSQLILNHLVRIHNHMIQRTQTI